MTVTNDLVYELMKRVQAELAELKGGQLSLGVQLASMEQHAAATQVEVARISSDVAQLKADMTYVKRRLDLVEA